MREFIVLTLLTAVCSHVCRAEVHLGIRGGIPGTDSFEAIASALTPQATNGTLELPQIKHFTLGPTLFVGSTVAGLEIGLLYKQSTIPEAETQVASFEIPILTKIFLPRTEGTKPYISCGVSLRHFRGGGEQVHSLGGIGSVIGFGTSRSLGRSKASLSFEVRYTRWSARRQFRFLPLATVSNQAEILFGVTF